MREILFRGKYIYNGEWVEGNLFIPDKENTPTQICIGTNIIRITYDVIPETVGQYTGLTDKNGKKIFEGDVVKLFLVDDTEIGVIKFSDIKCRFMYYDGEGYYSFDNTCKFEVIGNIHDNPELLNN